MPLRIENPFVAHETDSTVEGQGLVRLCPKITEPDKQKVRESFRETLRTGKEVGYFKCSTIMFGEERKPYYSEKCNGSTCHVKLRDCQGGAILETYHSHPGGEGVLTEYFSLGDLKSAVNMRAHDKDCIIFDRGGHVVVRCVDYDKLRERLDTLAFLEYETKRSRVKEQLASTEFTAKVVQRAFKTNEEREKYRLQLLADLVAETSKVYDRVHKDLDVCETDLGPLDPTLKGLDRWLEGND